MPPPPLEDHSPPVGCLVTPHRCPHSPPCIIVPDDVYPCPLILLETPMHHPIMKTYFPLHFPHITSQQPTPYRPSILSTPLDPPPSYDSLFATAAYTDPVEAPPDPWKNPSCWNLDADLDWDL